MKWEVAAECVSGIIVTIIFINSRWGDALPSLKNRLFQWCLIDTLISITTNIVSVILLYFNAPNTQFFSYCITTLYYISTPLISTLYFYYILSVLQEERDEKQPKWMLALGSVPYCIYFLFLCFNGFTRNIFFIDPVAGYQQGSLNIITYIVFYVYCLFSFATIFFKREKLERKTGFVLAGFPLIAVLVIIIQQIIPEYILSGSAAVCALLIVYLYFQNRRLFVDPLTGVFNRQEFLRLLSSRIRSQKDSSFTIIVVSMNDFKFINDKYGQHNGDHLLKEVCDYLATLVSKNSIYRYGGDQFALFLNEEESIQTAFILDRLAYRMKLPWKIGKQYSHILTCSVGIVQYPEIASDADGVINALECSMAEAKIRKNWQYVYCTPEMLDRIKRKHEIAELIKEALEEDGFELYAQPIFSISERKYVLAESLLRLNNTRLGSISPAEFIPIAEDSGLISDLTYWVLDRVCHFIQQFMKLGKEFDGIAINFSALQFLQEDLISRVCEIIDTYQIPYSKLKIEITESVLTSNFDRVNHFIHVMNQKGIEFELDDFGTGYSNFSSVLQLPLDTIKLDKSLVWSAIDDEKSAELVRSLSSTFRKFHIQVLAEGVETEEQLDFVTSCGCNLIQGFYYAKPIPIKQIGEYLSDTVSIKDKKNG